jgi:HSP20 family molecular chaperone IbpA
MATQSTSPAANEGKAPASSTSATQRAGAAESVLRPPVDIHETADEIVLRADMPGVTRERLDVRIDGNNLLIEGSIGIAPQEAMTALYADIRSTTYRRQFVLSNELDSASIGASLQNGVLTVRLPKRAEHKPRRIPVG